MSIEERTYQSEFWGNDPVYPPNHQFDGLNQWEAVQQKLIEEDVEVGKGYRKPQFQEDFEDGFV